MDREEVGDRWTLVNVLPRSGFIQTVHHGKRTKQEGEEFIKTINKTVMEKHLYFSVMDGHRTLRY